MLASYSDASNSGFLALKNREKEAGDTVPFFALETDSASFLYLLTYCKSKNIKIKDINIFNVKNENISDLFVYNKKIDGAFGWSPGINKAQEAVDSKLIPIESDLYTYIIVQKKSFEQNKLLYKSFFDSWSKKINTPTTLAYVSKKTGMNISIVSDLLFKFIPTFYLKKDLSFQLENTKKHTDNISDLIWDDQNEFEKIFGTKIINQKRTSDVINLFYP